MGSCQRHFTEVVVMAVLCLSSRLDHAVWRRIGWLVGDRRYGADVTVSGQVVARRLPVFGEVNAGKAATLEAMGAELDRVRAAVWARFSGAKTAELSKRQIRDRLMAEHAPADFDVPQRLWRATVEDTVDKIRAWQHAVIATEVRPKIYARAGDDKGERKRLLGLGHKKLSARRARDRAVTKDAVYQAVHDLVDTTGHIVAEDLSRLRGKSKFGRTASRVYAAWQRSFLADALASLPSRRGSAVTLVNPAYTSQQVHPCGHPGIRRGKNVYCQTAGCPEQGIVFDTEINAARVIRDRATDPQITRYTSKHEVKRILTRRAGTVENCPTTTQAGASTLGGGCERNNKLPKRFTRKK
jgi:IS605 OrfB family transposase